MANDPLSAPKYEKEIWKAYSRVTELKDTYYAEKMSQVPSVKNAYVTFRSMEGKSRTMQAYNTNRFVRLFTEYFCCMKQVFKKKKLLQKGFLNVDRAVDPKLIIWENQGVKVMSMIKRWLVALVLTILLGGISFYALWNFAKFEKSRLDYVKSDCTGESTYTMSQAFADFGKAQKAQQGLMNCYCQ